MQERYDDLDNLISTLSVLEDEIKEKDILEDIRYLKYQYESEKEELEERLSEEQWEEESELHREYERSRY